MSSLLDESGPEGRGERESLKDPEHSGDAADPEDAEGQGGPGNTEDPEPSGPRQARAGAERRGRRAGGQAMGGRTAGPVVLSLMAAVALAVISWSVPSVRTVLLQSFTRQPSPYTELYFTSTPTFDGATVIVPVSLNDHGTGAKSYRIRVTLESPSGKAVDVSTVSLKPHQGSAVPVVVRRRTNANVALVRVDLLGHPQTLHFSFGKARTLGLKGTS